MKKKVLNKIMDTLQHEELTQALYSINALLLIQKECGGKVAQKGIIADHFRQQAEELAKEYEGLQFFSEKVNTLNKEAFYQLCNAVKTVKEEDIHDIVFD